MRCYCQRRFDEHGESQPRRGAALVMAIVVLLVISLLTAEQVRRAVADRRQERIELLRVQAEAAADAAFRAARSRLRTQADWAGAVWSLPAGTLPWAAGIQVEVRVENGAITATVTAMVDESVVCRAIRRGVTKS